MCTKPAAIELQTVYEQFVGDEDFYFIGACKNNSNLDTLNQFRQFHNLTYPISSSEELGSGYNLFNETFITLGTNSVLIKKMPFYTKQSLIEESIEQAMVSFEGLYIIDDIKNFLLSEANKEISLDEIFYSEEGVDINYSIVSSSNPAAIGVELNTESNTINLTKNSNSGTSNVIIAATLNSTGDEIYSKFTVHNSSSIYDIFETGNLSKFSWTQSGDEPWIVTDSKKYSGNYSLKSTSYKDGDNSVLNLTVNIAEDDSISFAFLATDNSYSDVFRFTIDGIPSLEINGYHPWEKMTYPITAGTHHLSWIYQKSSYDSNPNYNLYLDAVILPENTNKINYELQITNYELKQNYPNPFNPLTRINYELRITNHELAEIVVYNAMGQEGLHLLRVTDHPLRVLSFSMVQNLTLVFIIIP